MKINAPLQLLGNITPAEFMSTYWQKKPLLVRGALTQAELEQLPNAQALSNMTCRPDASVRLIRQGLPKGLQGSGQKWQLTTGDTDSPLKKLPSLKTPNWTVLVQGVDLLDAATHELLQRFRFVPDARLDDAMFSLASTGGGVGPHFDSYDVFLLQTSGSRRWRIGAQKNLDLVEGVPLKILADFKPTKEYILQAGDMLYLPPRYAHDGVAVSADDGSDCITCSIGFRAPKKIELARELLDRLAEDVADRMDETLLYTDKDQAATASPAQIPVSLQAFAHKALQEAIASNLDLQIHLGEYLTEPKPDVWFEADAQKIVWSKIKTLRLNPATRMMFDSKHIFINGESFAASGRDAKLMQKLANERELSASDLAKASTGAKALLLDWLQAGWCHG